MNKVTSIPYRIDREELFERMHIYETQSQYGEFMRAYDELLILLPEVLNIQGIHVLKANDEIEKIHKGLCEVSHIVYCLVTLGPKISELSTSYFMEKDFLKGLMIDSMGDILLFNASNDYYEVVKNDIYIKQGYALTMRYSPDDSIIPMKFQKSILDYTNGEKSISVGISEGFMYYPVKTLGYVYGADKDIDLAAKDHDCKTCSNLSCEFRNVEE
ncbi:5-methyltetrahydrofolate--homocysteine methyltransferase [Acetobacterium bakii]|uniref:5-methyltetrahydrofolate--homocysteine methyltransferase n=1 Tax=Acetobacterium bakii TaxID=52689 RepID=A0A0L6U514_9FIRM|nr:5-methyltetrahydrofolate--homocysteine methyltransferase [Acetobacterium bakii]KNZ42865.1 5-methyltetrahydrofolate--homocysteine methyltransferase [Acetobacterium bakii]